MKYGELIKERRILGLTQQELSDYCGLSVRIIKSIESEKGNPSLKTMLLDYWLFYHIVLKTRA